MQAKDGGRVRKVDMLEYCMILLGKMSFDAKLFRKEYRKAFRHLKPADHEKLRSWARANRRPNQTNDRKKQ